MTIKEMKALEKHLCRIASKLRASDGDLIGRNEHYIRRLNTIIANEEFEAKMLYKKFTKGVTL